MEHDFSSLNVGESIVLPASRWDEVRPVYEQCQAYARTAEARPQFEFEAEGKGDRPRWIVRRTR